ncbi:MAG: phage baseplate assembly protein V [Bilophila wadsworthia]
MVGFDIAHLERRIAALEANRGASLRFGKVTGVEGGYARVQLADGHGMVSMPLATLHRRVLRDQDITMPDQGEPVAVLFSGQGLEAGVVLGAVYSPAVPDPAQDAHIDYRRYEDGTELWYDRVRHRLIAKVEGDIEAEPRAGSTFTPQGRWPPWHRETQRWNPRHVSRSRLPSSNWRGNCPIPATTAARAKETCSATCGFAAAASPFPTQT